MRVAIVGAGSLGTVHARAAASLPGVRVTRVADVDRDRASTLAGAVGALASVDAAEVVGRDDVDAVVVAVPTDRHREVVELAAAAAKHVFCEKPLALTLPDARAMIAACDRSGVRLMAGQVVRFFPEYARIGALLREGAVGLVATVRARRLNVHPGLHRSWYADPASSGGLIVD
ncbi:MAG: Gfo/Idh/MocA family oxidoreductase, partial [Chloroflexia bacterium]|nr:Gfo/Idh/MocA family oxidoreductase [Chloroflexia bacterium]